MSTARPGLRTPWTPAQLEAIGAHGRTLVSAAAGSGKTSVLVERIVRSLLGDGGANQPPETDPRGVLAVTFTRKAAAEMRERIARELFTAGELDLLGQLELATIGTIHSMCGEILREHGAAIGVDPGYVLLEDSQDAWYAQLALDEVVAEPPSEDVAWLLERIHARRAAAIVTELRAAASRTLDGVLRFVEGDDVAGIAARDVSDRDARRATVATAELWFAFEARFRRRLERAGAITFDDLERHALRAVQVPAVATALRERWQFVAIDEFQDTNERQLQILDAVAGDRLFMVGDQWQSIYRFRGADVAVFQRELASPATRAVFMLENFRSDAPVLDVVNGVFAHPNLFGDGGYRPVQAGSARQRAVAGPSVELLDVPRAGESHDDPAIAGDAPREREARRVAERIADLLDDGTPPSEVVIVFESGWELDRFEDALRALDVPTLRAASTGFYDQVDVRDVLAVVRTVRNPLDDIAIAAVLMGPVARLGFEQLATLMRDAGITRDEHRARRRDERRLSLLEVAERSIDHDIAAAAAWLDQLRVAERTSSIVEVLELIVADPRFELAAASRSDGIQRIANLRQLVVLASEARRVGVASAARFLEYVDAQRRFQKQGEASIADEASGAVRLMTIHASKGLEFQHVFYVKADHVLGSSGPPGSVPAPLLDEHGALHVPAPSATGTVRDTARLAQLRDADATQHHAERMRKAYVAMTRARNHLYVSAPIDPTRAATSDDVAADQPPMRWIQSTLGVRSTLVVRDASVARGRGPVGSDEDAELHVVRSPVCDLDALGIKLPEPHRTATAVEPAHLQGMLAASIADVRERESRLADGTRLHDAMARLVETASRRDVPEEELLRVGREPWLTERTAARLAPIVASDVFRRLVDAGARAEVPWVATYGATMPSAASEGVRIVADPRDVDAGRFDVLAVLPDGRWWIVDWKVTLPAQATQAWHQHGRQLTRYAVAAQRAHAPGCVLTLASLARDPVTHTWDGAALATTDIGPQPPVEPQLALLP